MQKLIVLSIASVCLVCAQAPASKQVEVFGQKIHYLEAGSGPDVILLHGLGADSTNWAMNTAVLAKSFHVLVPDQIGFGESDKPMINYRVGTLVDFLDGFYKKVGITKATVVGNSLGGWTAMAFTLAHPDKVERMVLVDSAGYSFEKLGGPKPTKEALDGLNPSTVAGTKALIALILANKALATDQIAEQFFAGHMKKNDGYTIERFIESVERGEDIVDGKLGAIKAPTQIIWGREDGLTPLAEGQMLATDIAGSQLVILDHCGHIPQFECAAKFNETLLKFLNAGTAGQPTASKQ
ncbi:MAG TPA: alpha/beta hydrolase [Bryobacteraceae bacterium]|jgi:pimeloyl-ACP methyl ester carboxylesterase|nr:alpha/beta hydrolase [Bryobacteraceae bacterium]